MDQNKVKGLIGAAGKAIALDRRNHEHLKRLEALESSDAFRDLLQEAPLGLAGPTRDEFIETVTTDPEHWRDYASQLAYSVDIQIAEYEDPSA